MSPGDIANTITGTLGIAIASITLVVNVLAWLFPMRRGVFNDP